MSSKVTFTFEEDSLLADDCTSIVHGTMTSFLNMENNTKPSKLAVCAAAYYIMAGSEVLKKNKSTRKRRRYWVNEYYKSRNK